MGSAIALGTLAIMGAKWASDQFANTRFFGNEPIYTQAAIFVLIITIVAALAYWLIGRKPRVVDFMISVESEMKKVNWSSKREIMGSTWVVIGLTLFLAVACLLFDLFFQVVFKGVGVLE